MARILANVRLIAGALALIAVVAVAAPVSAQQPNVVDPSASAVHEQQLLQQLKSIQGRGTIPDAKSYVIEHPAGREWQEFRMVTLQWIGGVTIIGTVALLTIFYLWRGSIKIEGGRSGRAILRFTSFERFVHWLTATCFVILAVTGLNVTFGRALFVSSGGSEAFSTWSQWAKYVHNYLSFAFTIGVVLMFLMWIGQNFPTRADFAWLKTGGGMFSKGHVTPTPAWKFNAGQKILYWLIVLGGAAMMISGYMLIFPFYGGLTVGNMELAEVFHGVVGMLFIALILAHVYLGTLGMEGAFESMGEGTVDLNWAKEHHPLWVEEELAQERNQKRPGLVTPAE
jgi:formate dehydrogenase subunit gamma